MPAQSIHNYEFQRCFKGVSDAALTLDAAEVSATREIELADFRLEAANAPETFTPWLLTWAQVLEL